MKTKNFAKKLNLNKKTITDLNARAMEYVKGGCDRTMVISGCSPTYSCHFVTCEGGSCATYTGTPESDPCCLTC